MPLAQVFYIPVNNCILAVAEVIADYEQGQRW